MRAKIHYHHRRPSRLLEDAVRQNLPEAPMTVTFGVKRNRHAGRLLFASVDSGAGTLEAHARNEQELLEAFRRTCQTALQRVRALRR